MAEWGASWDCMVALRCAPCALITRVVLCARRFRQQWWVHHRGGVYNRVENLKSVKEGEARKLLMVTCAEAHALLQRPAM